MSVTSGNSLVIIWAVPSVERSSTQNTSMSARISNKCLRQVLVVSFLLWHVNKTAILFMGDIFDNFARIPGCDAISRNRFCDYASAADNRSVANLHPFQNDAAGAYQYVIADCNTCLFCIGAVSFPIAAVHVVEGMRIRIEQDAIGPYLCVVTDIQIVKYPQARGANAHIITYADSCVCLQFYGSLYISRKRVVISTRKCKILSYSNTGASAYLKSYEITNSHALSKLDAHPFETKTVDENPNLALYIHIEIDLD